MSAMILAVPLCNRAVADGLGGEGSAAIQDRESDSSARLSEGERGSARPQLAAVERVSADRSGAEVDSRGSSRRAAALAHYARARTMLLESLAEFERARDIARPDYIMDADTWRNNVITRAQELDRVLDPQSRTVSVGIATKSEPSLVREQGKLPPNSPTHASLKAVTSLHTGAKEVPPARGRLIISKKATAKSANSVTKKAAAISTSMDSKTVAPAAKDELVDYPLPEMKDEQSAEVVNAPIENQKEEVVTQPAVSFEPSTPDTQGGEVAANPQAAVDEAPIAAKPIVNEDELRERLKKLTAEVQAEQDRGGSPVDATGGSFEPEPKETGQ